ncbi:Retrovirus-related Pol polyprotein from transposon [Trichinella zimbabwensis]|uniref:Retrovirus-related Pol polyprotein from transposon n=1 Tax=Trichinella zimbabwensis TaxID=268475 RepID=A0A0V1GT75_9BILA|nr:Retrovirus-related Pol polyprotein from transposon [Trichinella zimbabwensis]
MKQRPHINGALSIESTDKYQSLLARFYLHQKDAAQATVKLLTPNIVSHAMETTGQPVHCQPRRLPPHKQQVAKEHFNDLLRRGIIRPSNSCSASPLNMVPKQQTAQWRPYADYRALNRCTTRERYPLQHLADFAHNLHERVWSRHNLDPSVSHISAYFYVFLHSSTLDTQNTDLERYIAAAGRCKILILSMFGAHRSTSGTCKILVWNAFGGRIR